MSDEPADREGLLTDDRENNLIAAGAVVALLHPLLHPGKSLTAVGIVADADGYPTNQIDIELEFMRSPYRITVERVPDAETEQP